MKTNVQVSIPILLTVLFLTLKLADVGQFANMAWVWVFSPLWIAACVGGAFMIVLLLFALVCAALEFRQ